MIDAHCEIKIASTIDVWFDVVGFGHHAPSTQFMREASLLAWTCRVPLAIGNVRLLSITRFIDAESSTHLFYAVMFFFYYQLFLSFNRIAHRYHLHKQDQCRANFISRGRTYFFAHAPIINYNWRCQQPISFDSQKQHNLGFFSNLILCCLLDLSPMIELHSDSNRSKEETENET